MPVKHFSFLNKKNKLHTVIYHAHTTATTLFTEDHLTAASNKSK